MKFHTILLTLLWSIGGAAQAVELIPRGNGFQGYLSLGAGVASVESNFVAEVVGQDLGDARIDDLDSSPDSESVVLPSVSFELSYVFDTRTQVFVGNLLEDFVRFDFSTRAGVRQELGNLGRGSFSLLTTPLRTRTWEDPYLTGADRKATDTDINGFRLAWDEILGSGLEIRYSSREIDIDDEESGAGLGLTPAQRNLLDRNGDLNTLNVRYLIETDGPSRFVVGLNSAEADLDGDAMSYEATSIEINWFYEPNADFKLVSNLLVGTRDYDEDHPVFGKKADTDVTILTVTGFFPGLWGFKEWLPNAGLVYGQESSDIDFFDSSVTMVTLGFLKRF